MNPSRTAAALVIAALAHDREGTDVLTRHAAPGELAAVARTLARWVTYGIAGDAITTLTACLQDFSESEDADHRDPS